MEKSIIISFISMVFLMIPITDHDYREVSSPDPPSGEKWNIVKSADNIYIYEKWITVENIRKVRQLLASMTLKAKTADILTLIMDEKKAIQWQSGVKSTYQLKQIDNDTWYSYTLYAIPWPLNDQDIITRYKVIQSTDNGSLQIYMTGVPDYIPEKEGISRISHYCGNWVITPLDNGYCKVEYYVYSKQKSNYPRWAVDRIVRNNLWNTFDKLRKMINKNQLCSIDSNK